MRKAIVSAALVWILSAGASAQVASTPPEQREVLRLMDEIRTHIRNNDWHTAWRLSALLNAELARRSQSRASPHLELQHLEMMASKDGISRAPLLGRMARAALAARSVGKAETYAREALEWAAKGRFPWTGDAIHQGHTVLGRLALERGRVEDARKHMVESGRTPGSASLGALGPSMALAKELLDRGERDVVVEYLELCSAFWYGNRGKLAEWMALVKAGLHPDFGQNLNF